MVLKSTVLKPTLLIRLTGIFCFTVNRGCAVGADSLNGKKRLLSDVVAAGGGTYSFVPFIYYFLAREQAPIIDPATRLFLRLSKRGKRGVCKPHPFADLTVVLFNESLEVSRGQRNTCTVTLKMGGLLES